MEDNKQIQIEGPYEQIQRNYSKLRRKFSSKLLI